MARPFQRSLMFVSKTRAYPREASLRVPNQVRLLALFTSLYIRIGVIVTKHFLVTKVTKISQSVCTRQAFQDQARSLPQRLERYSTLVGSGLSLEFQVEDTCQAQTLQLICPQVSSKEKKFYIFTILSSSCLILQSFLFSIFSPLSNL